jgi:hypothetical protein
MDGRVQFITHKGKRILFIDLHGRSADEIRAMLPDIQHAMTSEPRNSVLSLSDWTDAQVTREVAEEIKKTMVFDRPHVKRTALVGIEKLPKIFLQAFKTFSRREFTTFPSLDQAKDWLVEE